jgi:hypothetical protein
MESILQVADVTAIVVSVGGAVALVAGMAVKVFGALRAVGRMADDFNGRPESSQGAGDHRPGVCARLTAIEVAVGRIPALEQRVTKLEEAALR